MKQAGSDKHGSMEADLRSAVERIAAKVLAEHGPVTEMVRLHRPNRRSVGAGGGGAGGGGEAASAAAVEELSIGFADGSSMQVIFKDLAPKTSGADGHDRGHASHARRPSFLHDPRREIAAYRSVLSNGQVAAPRFLGAVEDDAQQRFWLFIEDVPGRPLAELKLDFWLDAARWLAGMHRQFEPTIQSLAGDAPLLRYDADYFRLWILRAAENHTSLRGLMTKYDRVVDRLASLPATFVHGGFFASNVLVQNSPWGALIRPVDWEMAGIGPGLIDLAALITDDGGAEAWGDAERGQLVGAYYEVWSQGQHAATPFELFAEDLDFCLLHQAVQCLGWPQRCPTPGEGRNWQAEALVLSKRVGLV
ncbi:MAG: aminoglycoside phosphotransferase family protein [Tepidisphaeraceae bacterium]